MWNHHSSPKGRGEQEVNLEKVEKHLDLTNYLSFLQNLFSLSTSDSEGSDGDDEGKRGLKPNCNSNSTTCGGRKRTRSECQGQGQEPILSLHISELDLNLDLGKSLEEEQDHDLLDAITTNASGDADNKEKESSSSRKKRKPKSKAKPKGSSNSNYPGRGNGHGHGGAGAGAPSGSAPNSHSGSTSSVRNSSTGSGNGSAGAGGGRSSASNSNSSSSSKSFNLCKELQPSDSTTANNEPASTAKAPSPKRNHDDDDNESLSDVLCTAENLNFTTATTEEKQNPDEEDEEDMSSGQETEEPVRETEEVIMSERERFILEMNERRKRIWIALSKKDVPKAQRNVATNHRDMLANRKKLVHACSRFVKQQAIQSQRLTKETVWRAKRLTREMQNYWKAAGRMEKENKRRKEKAEEEQRKMDAGFYEGRQLKKKLNLLITQAELYAHLNSCTMLGTRLEDDQVQISILDHLKGPIGDFGETDSLELESLKIRAKLDVQEALESQKIHTKIFSLDCPSTNGCPPPIFTETLRKYQREGVNWMMSMFNNGINCILGDEAGLGKTLQTIALLSRIAEEHGVWGPFLIMAPSHSLHLWQQEIQRLVPQFQLIPYWGNPQERKNLRHFWQQTNISTSAASFHIVLTSYNIVVQDLKYFNKVKWQFLVLDEAQSVRTTLSTRWRALTGFNCRNLLMLLGPSSNFDGLSAIPDLLSLLHFVMPSLFLTQEESTLSEWFSTKTFENDGIADSRLLGLHSRLMGVLNKFLLRRKRKDVEEELCDRVEIPLACPLSTRQRFFHTALVRKMIVEDLQKSGTSSSSPHVSNVSSTSINSTLNPLRNAFPNVLFQFQKVCNHPDLLERREPRSPYFFPRLSSRMPKSIFELAQSSCPCGLNPKRFMIYHCHPAEAKVTEEFHQKAKRRRPRIAIEDVSYHSSDWSFLECIGMSRSELLQFTECGLVERMIFLVKLYERLRQTKQTNIVKKDNQQKLKWRLNDLWIDDDKTAVLPQLRFTNYSEAFHSWDTDECAVKANFFPKFLYDVHPKVVSERFSPGWSSRKAWKISPRTEIDETERNVILHGVPEPEDSVGSGSGGLLGLSMCNGWSRISFADRRSLVAYSGKLAVLDNLLSPLKEGGRQVMIFCMMPKMIELLEEYLRYRRFSFARLDSARSSARNPNAFVLLCLSTITKYLGLQTVNADTIIFYDFVWSSGISQEALDASYRLCQTKDITVYKLYSKGTIEEKLYLKTQEAGAGADVQDLLCSKDIASLLVEDDDLDRTSRTRQPERRDKLVPTPNSGIKQTSANSNPSQTGKKKAVFSNGGSKSSKSIGTDSSGKDVKSNSSLERLHSSPSSQEESDETECDSKELLECEVSLYEADLLEISSTAYVPDYYNEYARTMEWNGSTSDYEEDLPFIPKRPKLGRGSGKRGRPPSRVRVIRSELAPGNDLRRGPGRPRIKPVGPLNQGMRGRRPGRPPLSKKAENPHPPSSQPPRVFGLFNPQIGDEFKLSSS